MFNRKYMLPLVVATAAGGPYLLTEENWSQSAFQALDQAITADDDDGDGRRRRRCRRPAAAFRCPNFAPNSASEPSLRTRGPRGDAESRRSAGDRLAEVLRFDVTPNWVTARWPRVTATLAETGLEGTSAWPGFTRSPRLAVTLTMRPGTRGATWASLSWLAWMVAVTTICSAFS